ATKAGNKHSAIVAVGILLHPLFSFYNSLNRYTSRRIISACVEKCHANQAGGSPHPTDSIALAAKAVHRHRVLAARFRLGQITAKDSEALRQLHGAIAFFERGRMTQSTRVNL